MTIKKSDWLEEKLAKAAQIKKRVTVEKEEKEIVKKSWKIEKKKPVKAKKRVSKKSSKNVKNKTGKKKLEKKKKTKISQIKTGEEIHENWHLFPWWYMSLFNHLDILNKKNINFKWVWEESKWQFVSKKEFEKRLFLIFMSIPVKIKERDEWWDVVEKRLTQKDFSEASWTSETSLSKWKCQKWFYQNRIDLMKQIYSMKTPEVIDNLFKWATLTSFSTWKVDATAIKLWLEYIENFKPGDDQNAWGGGVNIYFWNWSVWKSQFINKQQKNAD